MIRILSDIHFGARRNSTLFHDILIKELEVFLKMVKKTDSVVILGDVFESRTSVDFKVLNDAINFFIELTKKCKEIFILVGNHDLYYKENKTDNVNCSFLEFDGCAKTKRASVEIVQEICIKEIQNKKCLFIPWVDTEEQKNKSEDSIINLKYDVVFGHFDIINLYDKTSVNPTYIDENKFKNDTIIMSGHYHKRSEREKIIYVGSIISTTFNDVGNTKGFYSISDSGVKFKEGTSPIFHYMNIEDSKIFSEALNNASPELIDSMTKKIKGNIIKLIVNEYCTENDKICDVIKKMSPLLLSVTYNRFEDNIEDEESFDGFDPKSEMTDIINQYIDKIESSLPENITSDTIKNLISEKHNNYISMVSN